MTNLVWFRNDLRVHDNAALAAAAGMPIIAVYIVSPGQWHAHGLGGNKVSFMLENVDALRRELNRLNIPLLVRNADTFNDAATVLLTLCRQYHCHDVFANREYPWNERLRDARCEQMLFDHAVRTHWFDSDLVLPPGTVRNKDDQFFKVFTPFKRQWLALAGQLSLVPYRMPRPQARLAADTAPILGVMDGFAPTGDLSLWPAGESEAQRRLVSFVDGPIHDYHHNRDFPALPGTSQLSAYLAVGAISNRQCLRAAIAANNGVLHDGCPGVTAWINELIWREFYQHIVVGFPHVNKYQPFRKSTADLPWRHDAADFQQWCDGKTGIPIVDAAMRQLRQIGWMHNRLRMICAMFLTKNLFIDWRWGERYFLEQLVDADFAANNGGWQWSASTGTDAAPYFRVFNPVSQSQRFDADGAFIKKYLPELRHLDAKTIHAPWLSGGKCGDHALFAEAVDYPPPMVDLKKTRSAAIANFRNLDQRFLAAM